MKKPLSFSQRLALKVHTSVNNPLQGVTMPYGFQAYVQCAAKCMNKNVSTTLKGASQ